MVLKAARIKCSVVYTAMHQSYAYLSRVLSFGEMICMYSSTVIGVENMPYEPPVTP